MKKVKKFVVEAFPVFAITVAAVWVGTYSYNRWGGMVMRKATEPFVEPTTAAE